MDSARIRELLEIFLAPRESHANHQRPTTNVAFPLSPVQLQNLSTYIDLLLRWNARMNLTAVRQPEEIVTRHFGESLFAARHLFPSSPPGDAADHLANDQRPRTNDPPHLIDVGSGAGFPGLPIKIWAPQVHLTLIESNHKKATFLREVVRTLTLTNVDIFAGRAEDFTAPAEVVTLRAVERFPQILPVAARLVAPRGRLALLIGHAQVTLALDEIPNFYWNDPLPIPLAASSAILIGIRQQSDPR